MAIEMLQQITHGSPELDRSQGRAEGGNAELALIVDEITQAVGGRSTILTIHPALGDAEIICTGTTLSPDQQSSILTTATRFLTRRDKEQPVWSDGMAGVGEETLLIAVEPIRGHSQLVLTVFFDQTEELSRQRAENVYFARRPFAIGYFRLWQAERKSRRHIIELQAALNLTEIGVLLIDRDAKIVFANAAGEQTLSQNDGLKRIDGALRAGTMQDGVRLQVAVNNAILVEPNESRATRAETAAVITVSRAASSPLIVSVLASAKEPIERTDVAAILFVVDPLHDTLRMLAPVCRLYRLSPVETKLVSFLAQGKTLSDACRLMHVKDQTARSYMKQIFVKTSTNRQNELIALMLSSVVRIRGNFIQTAI